MNLLDKICTIYWNGENDFEIDSVDGAIKSKITFYGPLDERNKVTGKGSRKYKHGLMVACHNYKEVKQKERGKLK